jgi:hypothetical protein
VQALHTLEVGATLYWSGYQECNGEEETISWATIPSNSDPEPRYPVVPKNVVADKGDGPGHSGHSGSAGKSATTSATLAPTTEAPPTEAPATEAPPMDHSSHSGHSGHTTP